MDRGNNLPAIQALLSAAWSASDRATTRKQRAELKRRVMAAVGEHEGAQRFAQAFMEHSVPLRERTPALTGGLGWVMPAPEQLM